jgi:uncharacterized membrane protein
MVLTQARPVHGRNDALTKGQAERYRDDFRASSNDSRERLADGLGWFSVGLGLTQLAAPRWLAPFIGVQETNNVRTLLRAVGTRELACGVGILTRPRSAGWLWARVAGDAMDLALLGAAFASKKSHRGNVALATAMVVGVTALDVLSGVQLGRRPGSAGRPRKDRAMDVKQSITVNRPPDELYRFWHDFENLPRFMSHLESVQALDNGRSHWKAKAPAGKTVEWDAEVVDDLANELIAWRSLEGADVGNTGSVRFTPAPGGRGTEVRVQLQYDPPGGAIGAMAAKLFGEEPAQQVYDDLRAFKQVMEVGEVVRSDASIHARPHPAQPPAEKVRA